MPLKFFGWEFDFDRKSSKPGATDIRPTGSALSPVPPENTEGALNIQYGAGGGYYGYYLDLDGAVVDEFQLINRYREMSNTPEVDEAVDQIINEMVVQDAERMPLQLNLDYCEELDEEVKIRIQAEFDSLLKQINFHKDAYSIVRQWYIDGRIYYYLIVDEEQPQNGILELRIIDPRTVKKVREVTRKRHEETQVDVVEVQREYFVYNPMGFVAPNINGMASGAPSGSMLQYNGIKIPCDTVAFTPSGLFDANRRTILSWLHKAIKPLNLLRMMEDSCVIYRVARAPERRVFYIDVGNLPKGKAEQYLNDIMLKYKNKLVYDVGTGELRDDRKFMSMLEDFWLPRREGGKGTEITTLPAGQNLSEMEDVEYFRKKLYRALNLPPSRIDQNNGFSLGRDTEISRDELRFVKFIHRLQAQFSTLFDQLLEKQLRLKNVLTQQDWNRIKNDLRYDWEADSYFEELKKQAIWTSRMGLLTQMDTFTNKYFSEKWIAREILKFSEDEMASIREEFSEGGAGSLTPPGGTPDELLNDGEGEEGAEGMVGDGDVEEGEDGDKEDSPFGSDKLDAEADDVLGTKDDEEGNDKKDKVDFNPDEDGDKDESDDEDESEEDDEKPSFGKAKGKKTPPFQKNSK